ncbi:hypothetical protein [Bradyrhizobium sp. CB2312]|uniref:hypothetical protein n=1 Tax=Bradyrhizobium sp. CB2312 TaxID=3039155 RepID=UPI0024B04214|nr:hypothetical protein [Bradyrhizobium sp. CB2312]WFU71426.1 hypothetical protein QA642_40655 [Bradyrhizobium sp. CB2312]
MPLPADSYSVRVRAGESLSGLEEAEPDARFEDWERDGALIEDTRHLGQWDQTLILLWFDDEESVPPAPERKQWDEDAPPYLAKRFSKQIGWQFGMMIHWYVHLGTADTPDVIWKLGAIPLSPTSGGTHLRLGATLDSSRSSFFSCMNVGMWRLETCRSRRQRMQVTSRWNSLLMDRGLTDVTALRSWAIR